MPRWTRPTPPAPVPYRSTAARVVVAALLGLFVPGCGSGNKTRDVNGTSMTARQMAVHGDDMRIEGLRMKTEGDRIGDEDMARRGEAMRRQGQQLVDQAATMEDEKNR